eukprot:TRINITY_DN1184_c0_g1_i3.p1 TRINITY_DN1184_c0_g1~~TRINITY_DN1184_c0_g1_i3.p1  ORF type:complete len:350 (-),score=98.33 TRINITY_DN1184_c0_g1_i3:384-1433(-)
MEKSWERAVESAKGSQNPKDVISLTLDGALKGVPCKLPAPALFEQFTSLEILSLANTGITSLEGFPCLPHLKRLILSDNRISGGLENLVQAGLKELQDLDISNNRIQTLEDIVPLSQLCLVSLDLYECPVTRLPEYRARVFEIVKSLKYLDKIDSEGKERPESDDEGDDMDSEEDEEEDVDNDDRSNGARSVGASGDLEDEEFEDEEDDDELDVEEEDEEEYQDGVTINGHGSAALNAAARGGHLAANAAGNSEEEDEVDDEDEDEAEVQDVDDEDEEESDEVADDDAGAAEDDDEEGPEHASGSAPGELDTQDDDEDDDGEVGDGDEEDEGVENDGDEGEDEVRQCSS